MVKHFKELKNGLEVIVEKEFCFKRWKNELKDNIFKAIP
jgi:hypothetical protein